MGGLIGKMTALDAFIVRDAVESIADPSGLANFRDFGPTWQTAKPGQLRFVHIGWAPNMDSAIHLLAAMGPAEGSQPYLPGLQTARPFLKWAGGKRQLLDELRRRAPATFGAYHEPFLGGGALYFGLAPRVAFLGDTNERLIRTYRGVQRQADAVISTLRSMPNEKDFFLSQRRRAIDNEPDAEVAAWLIFMNKTAYNGLYRVNRRGEFNTPFGRYNNPTICDADNLRACAAALTTAHLNTEDFVAVLGRARLGDFVYFDPPYVPLSANSSFTRYTADQFRAVDQERLRDVALELKRRGVHVLLSNSSAPQVLELYARDFRIEEISATRMVNCRPEGRGKILELLIS
jgi:DNA adenine methylase